MSILSDIELIVTELEALLPAIDAIPLSPELAAIRTKLESVLGIIKLVV